MREINFKVKVIKTRSNTKRFRSGVIYTVTRHERNPDWVYLRICSEFIPTRLKYERQVRIIRGLYVERDNLTDKQIFHRIFDELSWHGKFEMISGFLVELE